MSSHVRARGERRLGVFAPEAGRTILVLGGDGETAVALRERIDRAYAIIKDVRPEEAADGLAGCLPWPWMVIGDVPSLPAAWLDTLRRHPVLVLWRGSPPPGSPRHARGCAGFGDLAAAVQAALDRTVGGMRLAVGAGVDLPDGGHASSAVLQALVASHPHPLDAPPDVFRSAARLLAGHRVPCRPVRTAGAVALVDLSAGGAS